MGRDIYDTFQHRYVDHGATFRSLSDRFGARYFATIAMLLTAVGFTLMLALPVNFSYPFFALVILLDGMAMGMFISPNTAAIMNSLPEQYRGAGSGMRSTLINIGNPLSMAIIFSLMIFGLNALVPTEMYNGLIQHGIPMDIAQKLASAPPVGYLFASLLGYNPLGIYSLQHLTIAASRTGVNHYL